MSFSSSSGSTPRRGGKAPARVAVAAAAAVLVPAALASTASTASAAGDTVAPVVGVATLPPTPNGNGGWFRGGPVTLNLSATDDVAVAKFQYSVDGGLTYVDVPVTPGA